MSGVAALPSVVRLGQVDSTQAVAFALAAEGAADGTVVVADSQAAGRGRRGRAWVDEPGASLLTSIILRPRLEPSRAARPVAGGRRGGRRGAHPGGRAHARD